MCWIQIVYFARCQIMLLQRIAFCFHFYLIYYLNSLFTYMFYLLNSWIYAGFRQFIWGGFARCQIVFLQRIAFHFNSLFTYLYVFSLPTYLYFFLLSDSLFVEVLFPRCQILFLQRFHNQINLYIFRIYLSMYLLTTYIVQMNSRIYTGFRYFICRGFFFCKVPASSEDCFLLKFLLEFTFYLNSLFAYMFLLKFTFYLYVFT